MRKSCPQDSSIDDEKDRFDYALQLRNAGRLHEAVEILEEIGQRHPDSAATFGVLGGIYGDLGLYEEAIENFRKAISINPRSALATRGLFNRLWKVGREREALAALEKFTELTRSEEFLELIEKVRFHLK